MGCLLSARVILTGPSVIWLLQVTDLGASVDKLNKDKVLLEQQMEVEEVGGERRMCSSREMWEGKRFQV